MDTSRYAPPLAAVAGVLLGFALLACGQQQPSQVDPEDVRRAGERNDAAVAIEPAEPRAPPGSVPGLEVHVATGTVEAVDPEAGRVRIEHEEVSSAKLPAGSTEFTAENKDALTLVKPGQRIDFRFALLSEGGYLITGISPTPPES